MPTRPRFASWRLALTLVIASALFMTTTVSVASEGRAAASGGASAESSLGQAAAKKKKKARKRRLCAVTRLVLGRKRKIYVRRYGYRFIRRGGQRFRIIVRRRVALKAACARSCAVVRNGRVSYRRSRRKIWVPQRRGNRLVLVRRRVRVRLPRLRQCPKKGGGQTILGTPITIDLRDGSVGKLDFGAFVREAPLSGTVRGYGEGRIDLAALKDDVNLVLTRGRIDIAQTAVFIDDECQGDVTAAIRTAPQAYVTVDQTKSSSATLFAESGRIRSIVRVLLRAPLELRDGEEDCNPPRYIQTGYTQLPLRLDLGGRLTFSGALGVNLTSGEQVLDGFDACIQPGDPARPCGGFAIPFPFTLSTKVVATLELGKYGRIRVP